MQRWVKDIEIVKFLEQNLIFCNLQKNDSTICIKDKYRLRNDSKEHRQYSVRICLKIVRKLSSFRNDISNSNITI